MSLDPVASRLDQKTIRLVVNSEARVQRIENKYSIAVQSAMQKIAEETLAEFSLGNEPDMDKIQDLLVENFFTSIIEAIEEASGSKDLRKKRKLAKWNPRSLKDIMKAYDQYRKRGVIPKRQQKFFDKIKKDYLKKCRSVWDNYGEEYRKGETASRVEATEQIRKAAQTTTSRAKTIVRTETTSAYNTARKEYFDSSPDVTHYLFIAIRDSRTTRWCTQKTIDGKRGRHGLVYAKDDPLCAKETPACHWNCRSTMVPLTDVNPSHQKMIQDKSLARRKYECYPLPKGWAA